MKRESLKLGSLFDGIGGFPLAWRLLGGEAVWASEIEAVPIAITRRHFPEMRHLGDVTMLDGSKVEPVDLVTFGSPCTRLSVAGRHDGFNVMFRCFAAGETVPHYVKELRATSRFQYRYVETCPVCGKEMEQTNESALFFHAVRVIGEMREASNGAYPRFAVWENVPGAFSSNGGEDFQAVLRELAQIAEPGAAVPERPKGGWKPAGCMLGDGWSIAWRVLDAQYWGVPQRRRRIYLVADFAGGRAGQILFERPGLSWHSQPGPAAGEGAAAPSAGSPAAPGAGGGAIGFQTSQSGTRLCEKHATLDANNGSRRYNGVITAGVELGQIASPTNRSTIQPGKPMPSLTVRGSPGVVTAAFKGGQGAGAGGIGYSEAAAPTLTGASSGTNQVPCCVRAVAVDCRHDRVEPMSGTLQSKNQGGYSLNYINPVAVWPEVNATLCARHDGSPTPGNIHNICCVATDQSGAEILQDKAPTLVGGHGHPYIADTLHVRRLTPLECERLQGFPDGWTAVGLMEKKGALEEVRHKDAPHTAPWEIRSPSPVWCMFWRASWRR